MKLSNGMEFRLPAKVKEKWIDALLSEEYKQAKGLLVKFTPILSYCCLGVYGKVCVGLSDTNMSSYSMLTNPSLHVPVDLRIPQDIQRLLACYNDGVSMSLAHPTTGKRMKEGPPRSFKWIAAWIKRNL